MSPPNSPPPRHYWLEDPPPPPPASISDEEWTHNAIAAYFGIAILLVFIIPPLGALMLIGAAYLALMGAVN